MFYRVTCLVVSRLRWWLCIICLWSLKEWGWKRSWVFE
jgi:hypothetical protein